MAANGQIATELIQSKDYSLVFMDLQMPEMDGYTATRHIRNQEDEYFQKIPIIALTADAFSDVRERALAVGMNDYLSKPFKPNELAMILKKYSAAVVNAKSEIAAIA